MAQPFTVLNQLRRQARSRWNSGASLAIFAAMLFVTPHFAQAQEPAKAQPPTAPAAGSDADRSGQHKEFESGSTLLERQRWFHDQRAFPNKEIPAGVRLKAFQQKQAKLAAQSAALRNLRQPGRAPSAPAWTFIGPMPVSEGSLLAAGRVTSLALDTTDTSWNTLYMAGAEGGVWKTTDGGTTWTPLTDSQASLAIGSIAVDPTNHLNVYAGTGEENFSIDSYYGAGVLKSTDGGTTWTLMGASTFGFNSTVNCTQATIGGMAVQNSGGGQVVLAAVSCGNPGVYRSTNGGSTWTRTLVTSNAPATNVFFDPVTPTTAYAATGNIFGATQNGIYKSIDSGAHWSQINGTGSNVLPLANAGRMALAVYPGNTQVMYVAIQDSFADNGGNAGNLLGLYTTVDGGTNWTQLVNTPDICEGQCWYDLAIAVDPSNQNVVVAGGSGIGLPVWISLDGGNSWNQQSTNVHADTHSFIFSPDSSTLFTGNDGGVWKTTDYQHAGAGNVAWTNLNNTLGITEFYPGISIHPTNPNITFDGTQDNNAEEYTGSLQWPTVECGDGGPTLIDQLNPNNVYLNCIELSLFKSTDGGATFNEMQNGLDPNNTDRTAWVPALSMDPENTQTIYFGTQFVYQSVNGAALWTAISPDLTNGTDTISAIAVAPTDSNTVYSGAGDGTMFVTNNATAGTGALWTALTPDSNLPQRYITCIAVDPHTSTTAYIGFSGFTQGSDTLGHIFQTTNGGTSWTDISGDLPNTPVNWIVVDPNIAGTIYVATDIGTFYTSSFGTSWSVLGTGLPNVVVTGLALYNPGRILRASTHGRSVWDLDISTLGAAPDITSLSPSSANVGSPSFTLTVNGSQFDAQSVVQWNGSTTGLTNNTFVNNTQLTVTVAASLLTTAGTFPVTVMNLDSGDLSNAMNFSVNNPAPVVTSLSPASVIAGGPQFTLTVNGSSFVTSSVVQWNGSATGVTTTFVNGSQLTAVIPASFITHAGTATVTVMTPGPGGGTSSGFTFTINNPVPTATSLSPSSATAGGAQFTLTVNGTNFVSTSTVHWNASTLTTTFVSNVKLTATVPASDITNAGTASVTVQNPAPGGGTSNALTFTINNLAPTLTTIAPTTTTAGGAAFTLTANGTNFVANSSVQWNGSPRATTFVSSRKLTAMINAADIALAGTIPVTVFNPAPGGGTSAPVTFTIKNPVPHITSLSPSSTTAGGPAFTLTVNGTSLVTTSQVMWNGSARATTFVNSTKVTAQILASDIATAGTFPVTIFNPAPGGGTSPPSNFSVQNPVPTATSLSPSSGTAGGPAFTLTVNGTNFVTGSEVKWKGSIRTTTFVSSTKITAQILASDIAAAGSDGVTVFNPSPGGGTSNSLTFTVNNPVPTISTISPTSATAGGTAFTLTVNGTNFVSTSMVKWNGASRTTTFVNSTRLTAAITATDISKAGTFPVTVFNGTPGGGTSNAVNFTVNNPVPAISSISPTSALAGGAAFTLTVNGTGFVSGGANGSAVNWNGVKLTTTFVSGVQLTATVPASDITMAGTASVTVVNPAPGGGTSNSKTFNINNPVPTITTISPSSKTMGGPAFTLTVNGTGFTSGASGSVVNWNGAPLTTTFLNSTRLTASVPASDIQSAGTALVTVVNPAPGGGTSNAATFTINP